MKSVAGCARRLSLSYSRKAHMSGTKQQPSKTYAWRLRVTTAKSGKQLRSVTASSSGTLVVTQGLVKKGRNGKHYDSIIRCGEMTERTGGIARDGKSWGPAQLLCAKYGGIANWHVCSSCINSSRTKAAPKDSQVLIVQVPSQPSRRICSNFWGIFNLSAKIGACRSCTQNQQCILQQASIQLGVTDGGSKA